MAGRPGPILAFMFMPIVAFMLLAPVQTGDDVYLTITLDKLTWTSQPGPPLWRKIGPRKRGRWPQPQVRSDAEETWLGIPYCRDWAAWSSQTERMAEWEISLRGPANQLVSGELRMPSIGGGLSRFPFSIQLGEACEGERGDFIRNKYLSYSWRRALGLPGAAWFRYQAEVAKRELEQLGISVPFFPGSKLGGASNPLGRVDSTLALFSGGAAVAENLALADALDPALGGLNTRPISSVPGIEIPELNWAPMVAGKHPKLDALAAFVPADQHGIFFPSFADFLRVFDELRDNGPQVLGLLGLEVGAALALERYEHQLALPLDWNGRFLGGMLVTRMAITGGDLHFARGTDVMVIFEATNTAALELAVQTSQRTGARHLAGAQEVKGTVGPIAYQGVVTVDRALCSYVGTLEGLVVVTNSLLQFERLAQLHAGQSRSLGELDEFRWFRDRYRLGEEEEAFIVLSDQTIRRWASPRWRIGDSRRTLAAARMLDRTARQLASALDAGRLPVYQPTIDPTYGTGLFMTPVGEMDLECVREKEAVAYGVFQERYAALWREAFDPIAIRVIARPERLEVDLTVLPLAAGSIYRMLSGAVNGAQLDLSDEFLIPEEALRLDIALTDSASAFRSLLAEFANGFPCDSTDDLTWLGEDVSIWLESDPEFLAEMSRGKSQGFLALLNSSRLPVVARFSVHDPQRSVAHFEEALRCQDALGEFVLRQHSGQDYAVVQQSSFSPLGREIYLAALPNEWIATAREDILTTIIDRSQGESIVRSEPPLGESLTVSMGPEFRPLLASLWGGEWRKQEQRRAWAALAILDEWRRLRPNIDPVRLHELAFGVPFQYSDSGRFGFDSEWNCSTDRVYGHPGAPLEGPELPAVLAPIKALKLGLTIERGDGLRARARLLR